MVKQLHQFVLISILTLALAAMSGCKYTMNPRGSSSLKTIYVELFTNSTSQYGLEDRLTESITDAFISDGSIKIASRDGADGLLQGELVDYAREVEKFDENDQVQEYRIKLVINVTLTNTQDDSEIWSQRTTQIGIYDAATETEEDGQVRAAERLVQTIIDRTTKSW